MSDIYDKVAATLALTMWNDRCDISKADDMPEYKNIPCKLHMVDSVPFVADPSPFDEDLRHVFSVDKMYLSNKVEVKHGDKIVIRSRGRTYQYEAGKPSIRASHQRVELTSMEIS